MSESTSLYRRHRPGSFDEVVGQTHVVRTLRNAVEQGKVHHAYLFVGSRGTGKTSMAKILARSLNCERGGPTVTPCGECESCVTIAAGTSMDVIEMDAASNRSVDDVRDLRERVAYAPSGGRWKVYILDEAHMLTKEAWNAFLKTLEEPPPNTVFVLATTESHKVMATIADRCQRFDFQRPSLEQISEVLNRVAAAESIGVDDGAVAMIARSAQGSFRDALGTLDQLVAFGGNQVELKDVLEMLGAADADLLFEAVDAVIAEDPKGVLLGVEKMARSGRDPSQFARDLLAHLRHLLIAQTTGEVPTTFVVTATDTARMQSQAAAIKPANLIRTIDELATALTAVREGDDARLAVERALLKAARPDLDPDTASLLRRIERLESGSSRPTAPTPVAASPQAEPPPAKEEEAEATPTPEPEESQVPDPPAGGTVGGTMSEEALATGGHGGSPAVTGPAGQEPPSAGQDALSFAEIQQAWPAVLQKLSETTPALAATFEGARPVSLDDDGLQVGFPPAMTFNKKKADSPERRDTLAAAFAAVTGVGLRPSYVMLAEDEPPPPDTPAPGSDEVDEEELLERLKSDFDAEEVG
ncbi:MAG TPA: DNA polymerase III subunit gamma/tau [Solirubrobacterales bacterium]|nr:DNA polymerase III subunit gamma/tau [Solirubrobacterales bacterium]